MKNGLFNIFAACVVVSICQAIGWLAFGKSMTYGENNILFFVAIGLLRLTDLELLIRRGK